MSRDLSLEDKQSALQRILKATLTLPARITMYAAALGAIALIPQPDPKSTLATVATGVGVNILSSILERVARGDTVSDKEIRHQVRKAIEESKIDELLTSNEFQRAVARLARWHDVLRYAVQSSEITIVERLDEQQQQYETLLVVWRDELGAELRKLATREQTNEILAQLKWLRRLMEEREVSPSGQTVPNGQYIVQSDHPNPFIPLSGRIDDPKLVFDREREIARALDLLGAGASVAFTGPAGVGKSSLLTKLVALASEHLGPNWETAFLDLQSIRDEEDFYEALCSELGLASCRGYQLTRALMERRAGQGRRTLLCLDEIEAMTWEGFGRSLRAQLRGLAEGHDAPLKLVLAARTPLDRLFPDSEGMTSPLANICIQVDVGLWDQKTSRAFLAARLVGTGLTLPHDAQAHLMGQSCGHPARLTQAAYDLYADLTEGAA